MIIGLENQFSVFLRVAVLHRCYCDIDILFTYSETPGQTAPSNSLICKVHKFVCQGSHRLEKNLNLEGFLEKSLKIKSALKSTGKSLKKHEKSLNSTISVGLGTVDRDLNQHKIVVPLCCTKYRHSNFIIIFQY